MLQNSHVFCTEIELFSLESLNLCSPAHVRLNLGTSLLVWPKKLPFKLALQLRPNVFNDEANLTNSVLPRLTHFDQPSPTGHNSDMLQTSHVLCTEIEHQLCAPPPLPLPLSR